MSCQKLFVPALVVAVGLAVAAGSLAFADPAKDAKPAGQPEFKLPPGWTLEDMQACIIAGTPGEMHKRLAKEVGTWKGKTTMWMAPGTDPVTSDCTSTVTPMFDGRYLKVEMAGEIPGMGPYNGFGIVGYDNVAKKFQATWNDNHSSGIMFGAGELSADGKELNWKYDYHCPVTKKPTVMRQVETFTGGDSKTLDMFGIDPKSGKEFKMMSIEFTRK